MKKYVLLGGGILGMLCLGLIILLSFSGPTKPTRNSPLFLPTPTPVSQSSALSQNKTAALSILSTNPANGATNFPVDQPIVITFNHSFSSSQISYSISPTVGIDASIRGNTLILNPKNPLEQNKTYFYTITILTSNESATYAFATAGPDPNYQIDTGVNAGQQEENYNRQNYPDFYVSDQTPYSTSTFSVTSSPYTDTQNNRHYLFNVQLMGPDKTQDKTVFINWLKSLQMTDAQIASLQITYTQ